MVIAYLLTAAALSQASNLCLGGSCLPIESCVFPHAGIEEDLRTAGRLYGCSPLPNATICSDARFSCPEGSSCDVASAMSCLDAVSGERSSELVKNVPSRLPPAAEQQLSAGPLPGLCETIQSSLPSFCRCQGMQLVSCQTAQTKEFVTDLPLGGMVDCTVDFLGLDKIGASESSLQDTPFH